MYDYHWQNNEANFGPVINKEVNKGTHITCDILLKKDDQYIALKRQCIPGHEAPPEKNPLFLCHDLIRYGEPIEACVKRIVKSQCGADVTSYKVVDIRSVLMKESGGKPITQWAIIPFIIAEVKDIPKPGAYGNEVTEVVQFTKETIPNGFAWGKENVLQTILNKTQ